MNIPGSATQVLYRALRRLLLPLLILAGTPVSAAAETHATIEDLLNSYYQFPADAVPANAELKRSFSRGVAAIDDIVRAHPADVKLLIRQCDYIQDFLYLYEYADELDFAQDAARDCENTLKQRFPDHPEVNLRELGSLYGETLRKRAEQLQKSVNDVSWTPVQKARLYAVLSSSYRDDKPHLSIHYGYQALEQDETADVRIDLARVHLDLGQRHKAAQVLAPVAAHLENRQPYEFIQLLHLLVQSDSGQQQIRRAYDKLKSLDNYPHLSAARDLATAGLDTLAAQEFELSKTAHPGNGLFSFQRFQFAYQYGDRDQALAAYNQLRDRGWRSDPLASNRLLLMVQHPTLPWRLRDLVGIAGLLLAIGAIAALAWVPVSVVHYRGLLLFQRGKALRDNHSWQLKHAWFALFALGTLLLLEGLLTTPLNFGSDGLVASGAGAYSGREIANLLIADGFLTLLIMLPLAYRAKFFQRDWLSPAWPAWRAVTAGILVALAFRLPAIVAWLTLPNLATELEQNSVYAEMILKLDQHYGWLAVVWLFVLVAPVAEELIFRGVVLASFCRHVGFFWANLIQAGLFCAAHAPLPAMQLLIIFGLGASAGALARKSGGLLAPMVMHGLFNSILVLYLIQ
ncbi:type II CAAX endopeptidase family protein [Microbulbifer sp. SAOS-129_SWC]|uniref:CPBP family intramembrane glutamic endopeptidase n=1 Tax=Microbulbifer sp. SAOS-129_SWC TaxID=3145235 RepID=UPI0032176D90